MGADYSFYVEYIASCAPIFLGYIISVLASVLWDTMQWLQHHFAGEEEKDDFRMAC